MESLQLMNQLLKSVNQLCEGHICSGVDGMDLSVCQTATTPNKDCQVGGGEQKALQILLAIRLVSNQKC